MESVSYFENRVLLCLVPSQSLEVALAPFEKFLHWNDEELAVPIGFRLLVRSDHRTRRLVALLHHMPLLQVAWYVAYPLKEARNHCLSTNLRT